MARGAFSTSNYFTAPAILTAVPLTMSAWLNNPNDAAFQDVFQLKQAGTANARHQLKLYLDNAGRVGAVAADGSGENPALSTASFTENVWFHAAAVFSANNSRAAFFNGANKGTNTTSRTPSGIDTTAIGVNFIAGLGAPNQGRVAEYGMWNVALSDEEIAILAKGIPPPLIRPQNLVAYLPLVRDLVDYKGNVWTETGTVPVQDHGRIYGLAA